MAGTPRRLMHYMYNAALLCSLPLLSLYVLYRVLRGKPLDGWAERMGYLPKSTGGPVVWVHAVSAGEAVAAEAVIRALRERVPGAYILVTAGTPEGRSTATKRMSGLVDSIAYVPYDLPWMVARALARVRPNLVILIEAELWPNLIQMADDRGVPVMVANGYVSESTLRRGRSVPFRFVHRWIFGNVRALCLQSEVVRQRALALGAPGERVRVVGSVKYDQASAPLDPEQVSRWRELLHLDPSDTVFVAGSTHAGEEEQVLRAYAEMQEAGVKARLILAPRHPARTDHVEALVRAAGLPVVRRSQLHPGNGKALSPDSVILLDTMGELAGLFSLATVVFLGGSLVPVGGHDILQPLMAGKPVLLGPYTHRQQETIRDALAEGVAWEVSSAAELARRAVELVGSCATANGYSRRAAEFVASRRGASNRCAEEAARLLGEAAQFRRAHSAAAERVKNQ